MTQLGMFFRDRNRALRIWQGLFVCAVAAGFWTNYLTEKTLSRESRFFAMDGQSYYYISRACTFQEAKKMHEGAAEDAVAAMFARSPGMFDKSDGGYDLPEAVDRLYDVTTSKELKDEAARDAHEFKAQQIYQWANIGRVEEQWVSKSLVDMTVDAQVIQVRNNAGKAVPGSRNVRVWLRMVLNTNMAQNGRTPLVVISYEKKFL